MSSSIPGGHAVLTQMRSSRAQPDEVTQTLEAGPRAAKFCSHFSHISVMTGEINTIVQADTALARHPLVLD
jgi:hypothetical protein